MENGMECILEKPIFGHGWGFFRGLLLSQEIHMPQMLIAYIYNYCVKQESLVFC